MRRVTRAAAYARAVARELPAWTADLVGLASRLGLEVREVDADGFDGALVRVRELPLGAIAIRKSIREPGRKNFTIAHEIGHFLLPGHDQTELICTSTDVGNWSDTARQIEREADAFAAEVLMPKALVERMIETAAPSLELLEGIARRFRASLSAAAWRYCDLTKEPCAIVWSKEGRIAWSKHSESFGFSLPKAVPIGNGTLASRGVAIPKEPQEVPADAWISGSSLLEHGKIYEQSKALPTYHSVISLLRFRD